LAGSSSDDDEIPAAALNMAKMANPKGGSNSADLFKLQQLQNRVANSRKNFETGANRGSGGFSRS
jgi:hypothetical protein